MKLAARVMFLVGTAALLGFGIWRERHSVHSLGDGASREIRGGAFIEGAATDSYMLKDGHIFDIYGLTGPSANQKDCKT